MDIIIGSTDSATWPWYRQSFAVGHRSRTGHAMQGYYAELELGPCFIKTCC